MMSVFPKGARFLLAPGIAASKQRGWGQFLPVEAKMNRQCNVANYSFVVQVTTPQGQHLEFNRVDQVVSQAGRAREVERLSNSVQRSLHELHERTGFSYLVIAEGPSGHIDRIVKERNIQIA